MGLAGPTGDQSLWSKVCGQTFVVKMQVGFASGGVLVLDGLTMRQVVPYVSIKGAGPAELVQFVAQDGGI